MNEQIVTEITRRAMATEFAIVLPGQSARATEAAIDALDMLESIEAKLTIYQPASEISRINEHAGIEPVKVSQQVFDLLARSLQISEETGGAFDVTAGPLIDCWGFTKRRGQKPTQQQIEIAANLVDWRSVEMQPSDRTVFLRRQGMKINLGGIGKGYAIDQMAVHLKERSIEHFLIHGGKSTVLVSTPNEMTEAEPWKIAIEHPLRPGRRLIEIEVENGAVATSGSGKQFFHYQGKRLGHVIDPRSGFPGGDSLSMTIKTATATDADAYSTACFVLGRNITAEMIRRKRTGNRPDVATNGPTMGFAVTQAEGSGDVELHHLGE